MSVKLVALREVYYASKTRMPGDQFEASESDARILAAPDLPGGQKARYAENPDARPPAKPAGALAAEIPAEVPPPAGDQPAAPADPPEDHPAGLVMDTSSGLVPGAPRRFTRTRRGG